MALLLDGERLKIDASTCQNDITTFAGQDDVLSLLVHMGYDRSGVVLGKADVDVVLLGDHGSGDIHRNACV